MSIIIARFPDEVEVFEVSIGQKPSANNAFYVTATILWRHLPTHTPAMESFSQHFFYRLRREDTAKIRKI